MCIILYIFSLVFFTDNYICRGDFGLLPDAMSTATGSADGNSGGGPTALKGGNKLPTLQGSSGSLLKRGAYAPLSTSNSGGSGGGLDGMRRGRAIGGDSAAGASGGVAGIFWSGLFDVPRGDLMLLFSTPVTGFGTKHHNTVYHNKHG